MQGFQSRVLPLQVVLPVVTGHSGIADRQRTGNGRLAAKQVRDG